MQEGLPTAIGAIIGGAVAGVLIVGGMVVIAVFLVISTAAPAAVTP